MNQRPQISIDKKEIVSFCSITAWMAENKIASELREISGATDFRNPDQQKEYYKAYNQAGEILQKQGIHTQYEFYDSLTKHLSMPIDEALESKNIILKGLAILDKPLGKRRIPQQKESYSEHPVLEKLFKFRCSVEGIKC